MSTEPAALPRRRVRYTLLLTVALVAIATTGAILFVAPTYGVDKQIRFFAAVSALGLAYLTALFFGGFGFRRTAWGLAAPGLVILTAFATIRRTHNDGAMIPTQFEFRWSQSNDELLQQHRKLHQARGAAGSWQLDPANDLPSFRGPRCDGASEGPALGRDWKATPPKFLWGPQPIGGGFGGFAVAGSYLVALELRRDADKHGMEVVACYDRKTGDEVWAVEYPAYFPDVQGGDGPRATPTIADERVYSLGAAGDLVCIDAAAGKLLWKVNILADVGAKNLSWGMAGSPLVVDQLVIVDPGVDKDASSKQGGLAAYRRDDGVRVWTADEAHSAGYSSPQSATLCGRKQVLLFDGDGLAGYDLKTGKQFWRQPWSTNQGINVAQPAVLEGDRVFISSGYMAGGAMFGFKCTPEGKWTIERLWKNIRTMQCKFSSPLAYQGRIFGLNDVNIACIDPANGKQLWQGPDFGYGQLVRRRDLIVASTEDGSIVLTAADPDRYEELGRFPVFNEKTWNTPALAGRHLYVRNHRRMACIELPLAPSSGNP